jgi:hypothetical protein
MATTPAPSCAACGRTLGTVDEDKGRCTVCYERFSPVYRGPHDITYFTDMFAPIGPVPDRLQPHELAALAEIARVWKAPAPHRAHR